MGQATRDLRREVEDARERLAGDMQALAHQVNLPRRMRDKVEAQVVSARRRVSRDHEESVAKEAMWDIRHGRRAEGLRKLGSAALMPAAIALAVGAAAVVATRARSGDGDHSHSSERTPGNKGAVVSAVIRSGVVAAGHHRSARKAGRAPGVKHFAAYAVVGAATSAATKWMNDRIDKTAPII